jgi:hypothetical protein
VATSRWRSTIAEQVTEQCCVDAATSRSFEDRGYVAPAGPRHPARRPDRRGWRRLRAESCCVSVVVLPFATTLMTSSSCRTDHTVTARGVRRRSSRPTGRSLIVLSPNVDLRAVLDCGAARPPVVPMAVAPRTSSTGRRCTAASSTSVRRPST